MSPRKIAFLVFLSLTIARLGAAASNNATLLSQHLSVIERPDRVVIAWNGPVMEPMRDNLVAAIKGYRTDKRRLVISLNSPGGLVDHGREVVEAIRMSANIRQIETFVDRGGVCASMCVPIYLVGSRRIADPGARFMFHEAKLVTPSLGRISRSERTEFAPILKNIEKNATDALYLRDLDADRVNDNWRVEMRRKITDRDVWLTGKQLVDQESGVVDMLVFAAR